MEKTLYTEARKSDLTPSMQFSLLPFPNCKRIPKKRDFYISPSYSCHYKCLKSRLPSEGGYLYVVPAHGGNASHRLPQDTSPRLESYVGQSAKYVILAERAETQVPNIERALFILKNATPL